MLAVLLLRCTESFTFRCVLNGLISFRFFACPNICMLCCTETIMDLGAQATAPEHPQTTSYRSAVARNILIAGQAFAAQAVATVKARWSATQARISCVYLYTLLKIADIAGKPKLP